jgi:hypothetical protein
MVRHGILKLRYPDKPKRTDRAYTAAKPSSITDESNRTL